MAVVDNKPINNVYYQMKRLPPPAPQREIIAESPRPVMVKSRPMVIQPVPTQPQPHEVALKRRGNFPECSLPPDAGDCTGEFIRIFFDDRKMSCEVFYYSGCGGNANRFTSIKACYDICSPHTATVKGPEVLSGKRYVIMPKPGKAEPVPMVQPDPTPMTHPPWGHYDQEVKDQSKVFWHPDATSAKIPIEYEQQQAPQEVRPSKIKVIKVQGGNGVGGGMQMVGMGGPGMGMPGMMMGDTMFPNQMGMGMPAMF